MLHILKLRNREESYYDDLYFFVVYDVIVCLVRNFSGRTSDSTLAK